MKTTKWTPRQVEAKLRTAGFEAKEDTNYIMVGSDCMVSVEPDCLTVSKRVGEGDDEGVYVYPSRTDFAEVILDINANDERD